MEDLDIRIDSHKLTFQPRRVADWLEADTWEKAKKVYPIYWEITTSGACQHRCSFCSVDAIGYKPINVDRNVLAARMDEAAKLGVKSVMFAGTGEPLIHKHIEPIVESAHAAGLDTAFTTNGTLLNRLHDITGITWIKVSVNAGYPETYAKVHHTKVEDWDKVWENIRKASKRKGKCTIGVQAVVLPENVNEMRHLAGMAEQNGCDYFVMKPYSQATFMLGTKYKGTTYEKWDRLLDSVREYETANFRVFYRRDAMKQESESHKYDKCRATPSFWCYSMADGRLFTCSAHLLDERFCIGNLNEQSFQEIWEGEKRRENWELMKSFDIKQCRLNCRMDRVNKYLHEFGRVQHVNFI